ncbi:hypothetical protein I203_107724 [Kwoniella mangroviensis CBS 8507]|nr:uncharacterized protein I203_08193 [Kwoniella mangroviensis CBS 8507]OCF62690.1 hypothetical protein I203_08193 [Kwoniella mangroviensis CBS 8507]
MINQRYTYFTSTPSTAPPTTNHSLTRRQRPNLRIITSLPNKHDLIGPKPLPRLYDPTKLNASIAAVTAPLSRKIRNMRNREVYVYEENHGGSFLDMEGNSSEFTRYRPISSGLRGGVPYDQTRSCSILPATSGDSITHSRLDASPPNRMLGHKRKLSDKFKNLFGKARRMERPGVDMGRNQERLEDGTSIGTKNINHSTLNYGHAPTVHIPSRYRHSSYLEAAYQPPVAITYPAFGPEVDSIPMFSDHSEVTAAQKQEDQELDDEWDKNSFSEDDKEESENSWSCV